MDFELSGWMLILCTALSGLYTFLLYRRTNARWSTTTRLALSALRFAWVFLICFLILGPFFSFRSIEKQKPVIALGVDRSVSMQSDAGQDSSANLHSIDALIDQLQEHFEVYSFDFGSNTRLRAEPAFSDLRSDYSDFLKTVDLELGSPYLEAVVIAGDGLHNHGANPLHLRTRYNPPIYTVGFGDTTSIADWSIAEVIFNQVAFLGNEYPIEVLISGESLPSSPAEYTVELIASNGAVIASERGTSQGREKYIKKHTFRLDASHVGYHSMTVRVSSSMDEEKLKNNSQSIGIQVIDTGVDILIVYQAPHPDIRAIKSALKSRKVYQVNSKKVADLTESDIDRYQLIIGHNMATSPAGLDWITKLHQAKQNTLHIVGAEVAPGIWNRASGVITIAGQNARKNEVRGAYNSNFSRFLISPSMKSWFAQNPPLNAPFGQYNDPGDYPLLYQQVGSVTTEFPLITFTEGSSKQGFIFGSGLYRWRMSDYLQNENHQLFDELIASMVQYLSSKEDNRRLKVNLPPQIDENEELIVTAEVYNSSMQLDLERKVELVLIDSSAKEFSYRLGLDGKRFKKRINELETGLYRYRITADDEDINPVMGELIVRNVNLESSEDRANHDMLRTLAIQSGGAFIPSDSVGQLAQQLVNNLDTAPVSFENTREYQLLDLAWLMLIIALLMSAEWFVRKWNGSR